MAYLDILESSQTWTCPKTGYYQVICVGGGGGGGGAGFHFTGAIFIPEYYDPAHNSSSFGFKSANGGYISESEGGTKGSNGGSSSFGSYLTANGGEGGNGGGNSIGTNLSAHELCPKGGISLNSKGGNGCVSSSAIMIENYDNTKFTSKFEGEPMSIANSANLTQVLNTACNTGILSAVSGAGGAGGDVNTKTLFITKGTQIPCTVGDGGSKGSNGSFTKNEFATIHIMCRDVSGSSKANSKEFVNSIFKSPNRRSPFEEAFKLYLKSNVIGGGGGGGFTFDKCGGSGSEYVSKPIMKAYSREPYPFCNLFTEVPTEPTLNGGNSAPGYGYGAGGNGGSLNVLSLLGVTINADDDTVVQIGNYYDINLKVVSGQLGGLSASLIAIGEYNEIGYQKLKIPEYCRFSDAYSGRKGAIIIREVS